MWLSECFVPKAAVVAEYFVLVKELPVSADGRVRTTRSILTDVATGPNDADYGIGFTREFGTRIIFLYSQLLNKWSIWCPKRLLVPSPDYAWGLADVAQDVDSV
jgi:hypothetical protein